MNINIIQLQFCWTDYRNYHCHKNSNLCKLINRNILIYFRFINWCLIYRKVPSGFVCLRIAFAICGSKLAASTVSLKKTNWNYLKIDRVSLQLTWIPHNISCCSRVSAWHRCEFDKVRWIWFSSNNLPTIVLFPSS